MKKVITTTPLTPVSNIQYYRWASKEESFSYVGILTAENSTHVQLLTKVGEMTIEKTDGVFTDATREEFEAAEGYLAEPKAVSTDKVVTTKTPRNGSRTEQAANIINQMPGAEKADVLDELMKQMQITRGNASIYYGKLTK